jgi:acetyl esterase/lipase
MNYRAIVLSLCITCVGCSSHEGRPDVAPTSSKRDASVSVVRDVTYTPPDWPATLNADIYAPDGAGPFPAVVMIHGGGWQGRSRMDMNDTAREVARSGFVVVNISYRFAPQWRFPAQLRDVQQAVGWLRANAQSRRVDPQRIASWGYSSGAHLAALLAVTSPEDQYFVEGTRLQAVVAGGLPSDMRKYPEGPRVNALLGVSLDKDRALWRAASPVALVSSDDPPTFLYHGSFDLTVDVDHSRDMYAAVTAAHIPAELLVLRGLGHIATSVVDAPTERGINFLKHQLSGSAGED